MAMHAQTPVQIAWVTRDIEATEQALTQLMGAKKWTRMLDIHFAPDTCTLRGEPADFLAHVSFSYAGDMQLELIQPVSGTSVYSEFLDDSGPGLHHVAVAAPDQETFAAMLEDAKVNGVPVLSEGVMPGGMQFAYVSAPDAGVPYLEIAYIPPEIQSFFDYVKRRASVVTSDERLREENPMPTSARARRNR
jgi:catechol 2,3-dioxygenase-like lactoylglutathione lyase family enzyme